MAKGKDNDGISQYDYHEKKARTKTDEEYQARMVDYFARSKGTIWDKLVNFTKFAPRQSLTHFLAKYEIFKRITSIHGAIVECGVFLGGGLMTWAQLSAIFEPVYHMGRVIGFDTFEGFPALSEVDYGVEESDHKKLGGLAVDAYEDLKECIELYDLKETLRRRSLCT